MTRVLNIYVASSWRNQLQPAVVEALRELGHDVYDFRNPPGRSGFGWEQIAADWRSWSAEESRQALRHPIARAGFVADMYALATCDACVLVLPSGRSASFELGYAMGQEKAGYVLQLEPAEPELMYADCTILTSVEELRREFAIVVPAP